MDQNNFVDITTDVWIKLTFNYSPPMSYYPICDLSVGLSVGHHREYRKRHLLFFECLCSIFVNVVLDRIPKMAFVIL